MSFRVPNRFRLSPIVVFGFLAVVPAAAQNLWVVADFDGDRKPDLVTLNGSQGSSPFLRASLLDDAGLLQAGPFSKQRLRACDIDGDSDRDIIVESEAYGLLAVWINDGSGHFSEGNPQDFKLASESKSPYTLENSLKRFPLWPTDENPRRSFLPPPALYGPHSVQQSLEAIQQRKIRAPHVSSLSTRGPPQHS